MIGSAARVDGAVHNSPDSVSAATRELRVNRCSMRQCFIAFARRYGTGAVATWWPRELRTHKLPGRYRPLRQTEFAQLPVAAAALFCSTLFQSGGSTPCR